MPTSTDNSYKLLFQNVKNRLKNFVFVQSLCFRELSTREKTDSSTLPHDDQPSKKVLNYYLHCPGNEFLGRLEQATFSLQNFS